MKQCGNYWAVLLSILLLPSPWLWMQTSQIITAENASQLLPLLELTNPSVYSMGWVDDETIFVHAGAGATYYNITTGTADPALFSPAETIFSPDGTLAVDLVYDISRDREYDFYIYDAQTGEMLVDMKAESGTPPYTIAVFTPDGTSILFSYDDGIGHDGQIAYADLQGLLNGTSGVEYLCTSNQPLILNRFSQPDKLTVAMGGSNGTVSIWQIDDIRRVATDPPLTTVASQSGYDMVSYMFSDPETLMTREAVEQDRSLLRWWDIDTGTMQREMVVDIGRGFDNLRGISSDTHYLLVYKGQVEKVQLWEISHDTPVVVPLAARLDYREPVRFSPDSQRLAYIDEYGFLAWTDLATHQEHILAAGFNREVRSTEFTTDNELLLIHYTIETSNYPEALALWNISQQKEVLILYDTVGTFSPDGQLLVAGESDGNLHVFDAHTGKEIRTITDSRFDGLFTAIVFHPDGKRLACGLDDGSVYLVNLETGVVDALSLEGVVYSYKSHVWLMFSPTGNLLATQIRGSFFTDIYLWDVVTQQNKLFRQDNFLSNGVMLFSPDENRLVAAGSRILGTGTSGIIKIFDTQKGELLTAVGANYLFGEMPDVTPEHCYPPTKHSHVYDVYAIGFHPNGDFLAAASGDNVALWDIPTAIEHGIGIDACEVDGVTEMVYSFALPGRGSRGDATRRDNWNMTLHPTKPLLAFASRDGFVYLWNFSDPQNVQINVIEKSSGALAFSPDGGLLVMGGSTTEIRDVDTLQSIQDLPDSLVQRSINDVQFSPNGHYIVTMGKSDWSERNTLTIWGIHQ